MMAAVSVMACREKVMQGNIEAAREQGIDIETVEVGDVIPDLSQMPKDTPDGEPVCLMLVHFALNWPAYRGVSYVVWNHQTSWG